MFRKIKERRAAHRELMAKLDNLTDPTLIHRMYRPIALQKNLRRYEAEQGVRRMAKALAKAGVSIKDMRLK